MKPLLPPALTQALQQALRRVLIFLSYGWVMVWDLFILLCVANVMSKTALDLEVVSSGAWGIGIVGALLAFAHLKFRHRFRQFGQRPEITIKPIHTPEDHQRALDQIDQLWAYAPPGT